MCVIMIRKMKRCFGGSIRRRSLLVVRSDSDPVVGRLLTYLYGALRQERAATEVWTGAEGGLQHSHYTRSGTTLETVVLSHSVSPNSR